MIIISNNNKEKTSKLFWIFYIFVMFVVIQFSWAKLVHAEEPAPTTLEEAIVVIQNLQTQLATDEQTIATQQQQLTQQQQTINNLQTQVNSITSVANTETVLQYVYIQNYFVIGILLIGLIISIYRRCL